MTKKKRRRPSRQQASRKPAGARIARSVVWLARLIYLLLEIWDKLMDVLWTSYSTHAAGNNIRCGR